MKALVVIDSVYGNTRKIAETVATALGKGARVVSVNDIKEKDLAGLDLLVVGSPILGWNPSEKTKAFLNSLKPGQLRGVKVAVFDTRIRLFIHGDATKKIAAVLQKAGGSLVGKPTGFIVESREGPLASDALVKAQEWTSTLR
jgi:flavodoxin